MEAEGFSETTFADLIQAGILEIGDGYRVKLSELGGSGSIFLRAGHVTDHGVNFVGVDRFKDEHAPIVRSKLSRPDDVVVTTKGNSIGRTAYVTSDMPEFVYSPHLSFWRSLEPARLVPGFLRYWAIGPEFIGQLNGMKASTDMAPYLSLSDQRRLKLALPAEATQRGIAAVLKALDHKIELNRGMNRTLEAMAQTLFRSWFVDFEPVSAKAAGRQPFGREPDTVPVFPDHFESSAAGPVPVGWRVIPFSSLVDILGGGTPRTDVSAYWDGDIPWFSVVDTPAPGDLFVLRTGKTITQKGLDESAARLLGEGTTVITARGTIGNLALVGRPMAMNQSCYALAGKPGHGPFFVYFATRELVEELQLRAHGSVFDTITRATFDSVTTVLPTPTIAAGFDSLVAPMMARVKANLEESATLAALRDSLLPRLLSGEIRLQQAEKVVEQAGA